MDIRGHLELAEKGQSKVEPGFPFARVAEQLRSYDLLIGNLECALSSRGKPTRPKPLRCPASSPTLLREAGFDGVSIANNHSFDYGPGGYEETIRLLKQHGLPHFGAHLMNEAAPPFHVFEVRGIKIAIVGHYNRRPSYGLSDVAKARAAADVVIAFPHWGIDFDLDATRFQRQWGRALLDAGADAVVGAHPHVLQRDELHQGKLIAHSIGNFVFAAMVHEGTRTGALLELDLEKAKPPATGARVSAHRYRKVKLDERGAPYFTDDPPTPEPPLDPPGPRPLKPLGQPINFGAIR